MASFCPVISPVGAVPFLERVCLLPGLWHLCVLRLALGCPRFWLREAAGQGGTPTLPPPQVHQVKLRWC